MNDLIVSIAKERLLPTQVGVIDYPNANLENQLYHMTLFLTRDILETYIQLSHLKYSEQITLELTLMHHFPTEWLKIAKQSPNHHIRIQKIVALYEVELPDDIITQIQRVIEFLLFEIIETSVIRSNFQPLASLIPRWLNVGIRSDPILKNIIYNRHKIVLVSSLKTKSNMLQIHSLPFSNKAQRLLRAFIEEYVRRIIRSRSNPENLTLEDVRKYFNNS
jgi:hypothetical protein